MSSSSGAGKTVCVTGASGYIASWLVKLLLERGYTVKASVRDPNDPRKTEHLRRLPGANDRLHLFKANLADEGCFDSIINGCEGVFHTASPCFVKAADPQTEIIDPAVKGTLNVLGSCAKTPSVKRVVVTSSMASVLHNGKPRTPKVVVDETWFSDSDFCRESKGGKETHTKPMAYQFGNISKRRHKVKGKNWYALSKTLAEESAWKFATEHGIDLVTIHPSAVIGPLLQPTLNSSTEIILNLVNGIQPDIYGILSSGWVDVKDVANAHILAFEVPSAQGRYCIVGKVAHCSEIVKILRELYPQIQHPEKDADDKPFVPDYDVSKDKAKSLGTDFIPLEVSLKETVESFKEKKLVSF
ncbi:hypothetical protein IFM89_017736 [Coptis chinensis]|uniref:NAD-dependent epimerase/dehydratase domain-containing protein n=1 Tax=Coptis chinensis TaxID=261450 RepID=A0A835HE15_9MAGN|nr:hypothetical protein IFM89_017736 [Coptis chinensis]